MNDLPYEIVDATAFPLETINRLSPGTLVKIIDTVYELPPGKIVRFLITGSLIHIAQHLRNAASRKGRKLSIAVRGSYIYVGRG
jgi:hypothetical protein